MMVLHQLVWSQVILPRAAGLSKDQNRRSVGSGTAEEQLRLKNKNTSLERFRAVSFSMHCSHNAEQLSNIRRLSYNKGNYLLTALKICV